MSSVEVDQDLRRLLERLLRDFEWYAESFLWVQDKQTLEVVPMRLKPVQRRLVRWMLERFLAGVPVRVIILKARREGVSTAIQAFFYWLCSTRRFQVAATLSHHDDTTKDLHEISERFNRHSPDWLRPMKKKSRRGQVMEFANPSVKAEVVAADPGLQSVMQTVTAKNAGAGKGANLVHCSEVALWESNQIDAESVLLTLLQIVPTAAGTIVALESTARGVGNEFYKRWKLAERRAAAGHDGFYPFFIAWFEEPTNVDLGASWESLGDLDEREIRLRDVFGCSAEQVAWRRNVGIPDLCGGDPLAFDQEYPESPDVAFLSSGRPYFDMQMCQAGLDAALTSKPLTVGELEMRDDRAVFRETSRGKLTVWELPDPAEDYLVVLDPSEGASGDPQAATVLKRSSLKEVAAWHGSVDRDILADQMLMLGRVYGGCSGEALMAVEMSGGWGHTPVALMRKAGYGRLYRERIEGKKRHGKGVRLGWYTTETSRPLALDALGEAIRNGEFECSDPGFWSECMTFVYSDSGKPQAESGAHDDRVISKAVAVRLWQIEPRRRRQPSDAPPRRVVSARTGY